MFNIGQKRDSIIAKAMVEQFEKGRKPAQVNEIRIWKGKRYKKLPNGRWVEISKYGMTKREHEFQAERTKESLSGYKDSVAYKEHLDAAKNLSEKEFDNEDFEENVDTMKPKKGTKVISTTSSPVRSMDNLDVVEDKDGYYTFRHK